MKWKCNACAETENGYLPCVYENQIVKQEPTFCPLVKDECDWEPFDVAQQPLSSSEQSSSPKLRKKCYVEGSFCPYEESKQCADCEDE